MTVPETDADLALKFAPFTSEIELPFYKALSNFKIDVDRLDDSTRPVLGLYEHRLTTSPEASCRMQILGDALTSGNVPAGFIRAEGKIKNFNTIESFKNADKTAIMRTAAKQIWDAINDSTIFSIPSLLASFTIISFADLKKYKFTYWFAFPALHSTPVWTRNATEKPSQLSGMETSALAEAYGTWRYCTDVREHGFFLAKRVRPDKAPRKISSNPEISEPNNIGFEWEIGSLRNFESGFFENTAPIDQFIAFVDPSTYPDNPGWMLRNLLVLIRKRFKISKAQILCYRETHSRRCEARSLVLLLETDNLTLQSDLMPTATGWERNRYGKIAPTSIDLGQYMDPQILASSAVELNTKLIKWRIAPNLDLERIKVTKCLLLGAGTLGTYVARLLLGWNVRTITFVDNATVSYSNPVRQPLFNFDDCINGGSRKALVAAEALKKIYPGVNSSGYAITVPMLGHPFLDEKQCQDDFKILERLIDDHDAIFLLMDTRESRWLPTVMGKAKSKLVLNAALGFDSWVVMRHGIFPSEEDGLAPLGCYFCNDVVVPVDSVKDQTLDQQCTVTRPGIAPIASAQLVELLSSILQHPLGPHAPAPKMSPQNGSHIEYERDPPDHPLGIIPHQIRGFAATFQNIIVSGQSYDCCSACSPKITDEFKQSGWDFVKRALSDESYIPNLSGLAEVQKLAEIVSKDLDWSENEGSDDLLGE
ncbi:Ubiquitin-like modifier-activating enzyme atg7 [Golovinomyces cichoracearum]|uniref:Ubiquitin-like modifier-activating enzyme ATG7 n=1 Tax=Golovinomyces cichoracearum TaxID=62708 RepID=A0A420H7W7_9PEZI|nr:Ubiquitin-like modifier-activating enzyme atg7 [Golovinomyces cichoracearum]